MRRELAKLVLLLLLFEVYRASSASRIPETNLKIGEAQGPNTCVTEEIPGHNYKYWLNCKYHKQREVCGQKTILRYVCCDGYHVIPGYPGCAGITALSNVLETAKNNGAKMFAEFIELSGLKHTFTDAESHTLFAPLDSAFEKLSNEQRLRLLPNDHERPSTILLHAIDRKITTDQFDSRLPVASLLRGENLYLYKLHGNLRAVNCVLVVRKDLQATNGVVHIIDRLLDPYLYTDKNLADLIAEDGRFDALAQTIEDSPWKEKLENPKEIFTILAPSDEAFQKLPQGKLSDLLDDPLISEALLDNHVIPYPLCPGFINGKMKVETIGKEKLHIDCDSRGKLVNGHRLHNEYQIGRNGLVYMVDDLILPDRAKDMMQLAKSKKLYTFFEIMRHAKLVDELEDAANITIFVPSEDAMHSLDKEELRELKEDEIKAKDFVLRHIVKGQVQVNNMAENQKLRSLDNNSYLRVHTQLHELGVENAHLERSDIIGASSCMHVVSKPFKKAALSAHELLSSKGDFHYFLIGLDKVLSHHGRNKSYTIFAPTDEAFNKMNPSFLARIEGDHRFNTKVMKNHIVEHLTSSDMFKIGPYYEILTKNQPVYLQVLPDKRITVGEAFVISSDHIVKEGVVHIINRVMYPDHKISFEHYTPFEKHADD